MERKTNGTRKRRPRFRRVRGVPVEITDRDVAIIRCVHRYRFLHTEHILSLTDGSKQKVRRRLRSLYDAGFLDRLRPEAQRVVGGPMVYAVGNRGAEVLAEVDNIPRRKIDWTWKNRDVGRLFVEHTLLVADVMVGLACACRRCGNVRLIETGEILKNAPEATRRRRNPFQWRVHVNASDRDTSIAIVPDRVFGLQWLGEPEGENKSFFFLEADRATMPVVRKNLRHTSIYKKFLGYHATWRAGLHTEHFGFKHVRVLFVTTSASRAQNFIKANRQATNGSGFGGFLFTDVTSLLSHANALEAPWHNGRGEVTRLLD